MHRRTFAISLLFVGLGACPKPGADVPQKGNYQTQSAACRFTPAPLDVGVDACDYFVKNILKLSSGTTECEKGEVVVDAAGTPVGGESKTQHLVNVGKETQIAVYDFQQWHEEGGSTSYSFVIVRNLVQKKLFYYLLGSAEHPGTSYADNEFTVSAPKVVQVLPGGAEEVLFSISTSSHDGDMSSNSDEGERATSEALLWLGGSEPVWLGAATIESESYTGPLIEGEDGPPYKGDPKSVAASWGATGLSLAEIPGKAPLGRPGTFAYGAVPSECPAVLFSSK